MSEPPPTRCGFVTLLGAPNAGKSTLMNTLVGTKVSIVSAKVQTTRARITGILSDAQHQVVFVDTPGVFLNAKRQLEKTMVAAAWEGVEAGDATVFLLDAARASAVAEAQSLLHQLAKIARGQDVALVLNKIDLVRPAHLLPLAQTLSLHLDFAATFMISAKDGAGVPELAAWVRNAVPKGPFLYPPDQVSDMPERHLAAEILREKLFASLHQELPYNLTVETEQWQQGSKGIRIEQTIYVTRASHKAMVLGKGGRVIKRVGQAAREELSALLGMRVHLFVFVKVREKWLQDPERYRAMGLVLDKAKAF